MVHVSFICLILILSVRVIMDSVHPMIIKLPGAIESKIGNPNVTWETASKQNYGVDMHFFDGHLKTSLTISLNIVRTYCLLVSWIRVIWQ